MTALASGFAGVILHEPIVVMGSVFFGMLNRETAVFIPVFALINGIWNLDILSIKMFSYALTAFCVGFIVPRLLYGRRERYCRFNMVKENIKRWKIHGISLANGYLHSSILLFLFLILTVINFGTMHQFMPFVITMWIFVGAMIVPSVWSETRVFYPVLLAMIPMVKL